jgi:hypothetical protein
VLAANIGMRSVLSGVGYAVHSTVDEGVYEISFRFDQPALACITEEYE